MSVKEVYERIGGNYEDIQNRLRSDDMIERFLRKFLNEKSYEDLLAAVEADNVEEAIQAAHKMKGVTANLSFTKLFDVLNELLTKLRQENKIDKELVQQITEAYQQTVQVLREL